MSQTLYVQQNLPTYKLSAPTVAFTTMSQSLISAPFQINNSYNVAMQFIWTGTPTGTLKVMGSLDGVNYNIELATDALSGSAGTYTFDTAATAGITTTCGWVQGQYLFTSGTGVLTTVTAATKFNKY